MIAFDFETALIEPGLQAPPPVCFSWATVDESSVQFWPEAREFLEEQLAGSGPFIGANIGYDLLVALAKWPELFPLVFDAYDRGMIYDVQIRQKLIDIAMGQYRQYGYTLADLTKRLCDRTLAKEDTWRLRYWELISVPLDDWPQDAIDYSLDDAEATRDVFLAQEEGLSEEGRLCVLDDQHRQGRADFALKLASAWGLRTDAVGVAKLRKECETTLDSLKEDLLTAGLLKETKKGVSRAMRVAQARMLEINPNAKLTKKGEELQSRQVKYISVDAEACEDSGDELLEKYSEYSQVSNLLSGHVVAMEEGVTLPIHTRFEVLLDTGRTSSSGPNVQNVRRAQGARECFVPREGWVYIGCDFDKAELHTLAQVCINLFGESKLGDALNNGFDPHIGLGARLANMSYDDLLVKVEAEDEVAKEWRRRAKPGNFGFPGGMGPKGMVRYAKSSYGVIISLEEAEQLYAGWQEEYPIVSGNYLEWIRELTSATGSATIEHFDSKRWRGRVSYCVAANSFFQGMSADGMKAALYEVTKSCYLPGDALYGCRVVNEVHDEIIVEAPEDRASDAAWLMRDKMIEAYNRFTRDVPVRATPALMDRWSKKAKTIVENGELKVWRYEG
jgi:DNA polymerase-1